MKQALARAKISQLEDEIEYNRKKNSRSSSTLRAARAKFKAHPRTYAIPKAKLWRVIKGHGPDNPPLTPRNTFTAESISTYGQSESE